MKKLVLVLWATILVTLSTACGKDRNICAEPSPEPDPLTNEISMSPQSTAEAATGAMPGVQEAVSMQTEFYIKVNGMIFTAVFAENSSADAFRNLLHQGDLTVSMHDYGSFEKVGTIGESLPQNNTQISTEPGDVILYLGNQITIYYDTNTWSFTRLGKIQHVTKENLLSALGSGDATVCFSLTKDT